MLVIKAALKIVAQNLIMSSSTPTYNISKDISLDRKQQTNYSLLFSYMDSFKLHLNRTPLTGVRFS